MVHYSSSHFSVNGSALDTEKQSVEIVQLLIIFPDVYIPYKGRFQILECEFTFSGNS